MEEFNKQGPSKISRREGFCFMDRKYPSIKGKSHFAPLNMNEGLYPPFHMSLLSLKMIISHTEMALNKEKEII